MRLEVGDEFARKMSCDTLTQVRVTTSLRGTYTNTVRYLPTGVPHYRGKKRRKLREDQVNKENI